mmetsp:Transcript_29012/g.48697  ORF Transcript_29012/g.48697 Transcript_29012/m.48697 type:complete len:206 (+) Transcript_29012:1386-2003(+)
MNAKNIFQKTVRKCMVRSIPDGSRSSPLSSFSPLGRSASLNCSCQSTFIRRHVSRWNVAWRLSFLILAPAADAILSMYLLFLSSPGRSRAHNTETRRDDSLVTGQVSRHERQISPCSTPIFLAFLPSLYHISSSVPGWSLARGTSHTPMRSSEVRSSWSNTSTASAPSARRSSTFSKVKVSFHLGFKFLRIHWVFSICLPSRNTA